MMSRFRMLKMCLCAWGVCALVPATAAAQQTDSAEQATSEDTGAEEAKPKMKDVAGGEDEEDVPDIVVSGNVDDGKGQAPQGWTVEFFGYVRAQYTTIQDDPNLEQFGRNDGFSLPDTRLGFFGYLDNGLGFEIEVNATSALGSPTVDDAILPLATRLKDGYLFYKPHPLFRASAGQFKVPFDIEELISTANILFVERSIGNRGVLGVEGFNRQGLSEGRQLGVRVDSEPWFFLGNDDGPGVSYAVAATNGQDANVSLNDNDQLAFFGRLNLHWGSMVRLGGGAYYNDRTLGERPNLIGEKRTGWTADLTVNAAGFTLLSNIIQVEIEPGAELAGESTRTARSYQVQVAYEEPFFGLQPAYRFAFYDPDTDTPNDASVPSPFESLTYHTIGLNYNAKTYPVRVMLNYTLTGEETYEIDNDRFDALVQVEW